MTDIGPRGGSALKNLPWEIFASFTSFSAFPLTPRMGNFLQQKHRQNGGEKGGEKYAALSGQLGRHGACKFVSHEPGKGPQVLQMPQPIAGSIQPLPWGRNRHVGQVCCEQGRRRGHNTWELPGEAPGQVKALSAGFVTSCATKSVQIANAPTAQLCCLPTIKTEQNTKYLHPQLSPW